MLLSVYLVLRGKGLKGGVAVDENEFDGAGGAVTLLADDDLGDITVGVVLSLIVDGIPVNEEDDVGILLDGAGLTKVRKLRTFIGPVFKAPVEPGKGR